MRLRRRPPLLVCNGVLVGDGSAEAAAGLLLPPVSDRVDRGEAACGRRYVTSTRGSPAKLMTFLAIDLSSRLRTYPIRNKHTTPGATTVQRSIGRSSVRSRPIDWRDET